MMKLVWSRWPLALLALVVAGLVSRPAAAHGGEDHAEAPVAMPSVGAVVHTAEARGSYELLLRWGPATAGEPLAIEAFVADVASNAPIEGSLKLTFAGPGELTLEGKALSPGQYALSGRFPALGR